MVAGPLARVVAVAAPAVAARAAGAQAPRSGAEAPAQAAAEALPEVGRRHRPPASDQFSLSLRQGEDL